MTTPPPRPSRPAPEPPTWLQRKERGSQLLLRFMTWLSLTLGRRATRPIVYGIAFYFLLAVPAARTASHSYLQRVLGRRPRWGDRYRHILTFASTIHDRVYLLNERHALFDIRVVGEDLFFGPDAPAGGFLVFGAHLGSFEVLRTNARRRSGRPLCAAMYPANARRLNSMLAHVNTQVMEDIIPLGRLDSVLQLSERIEAGAMVALLADRAVGPDAHVHLPFLGSLAAFPLGPFKLAATLRRPVYFMTGLYRGGARYEIHFERLADFSATPRHQREAAIRAAVERYAGLIEQYCRQAPYNWFNFYDFWHETPTRPTR